jgi:hypothetical protein
MAGLDASRISKPLQSEGGGGVPGPELGKTDEPRRREACKAVRPSRTAKAERCLNIPAAMRALASSNPRAKQMSSRCPARLPSESSRT